MVLPDTELIVPRVVRRSVVGIVDARTITRPPAANTALRAVRVEIYVGTDTGTGTEIDRIAPSQPCSASRTDRRLTFCGGGALIVFW